MYFITRVYHPNINERGFENLDIRFVSWSPMLTVETILMAYEGMLRDPNPHDPVIPAIARLYLNDKGKFEAIARQYTRAYAF